MFYKYLISILGQKKKFVFPIAWSSKLGSVGQDFFHTNLFLSFLLQLINHLTCSTLFLVPNIDQMYKEMKKMVEVGNGDEFPNFVDLFFFWHKKC